MIGLASCRIGLVRVSVTTYQLHRHGFRIIIFREKNVADVFLHRLMLTALNIHLYSPQWQQKIEQKVLYTIYSKNNTVSKKARKRNRNSNYSQSCSQAYRCINIYKSPHVFFNNTQCKCNCNFLTFQRHIYVACSGELNLSSCEILI